MNKRLQLPTQSCQSGMGLVEIMVALVIGLVASLVIFQTMRDSGHRATVTTTGGDVQTSGTLGMYYLERDLRLAGWGFAAQDSVAGAMDAVNCNTGTLNMLPVSITQGAANASDTITVIYGSSARFTGAGAYTGTGTSIATRQRPGFVVGDRVLLVGAGNCVLTAVSGVSGSTGLTLAAAASGNGSIYNLGAAPVRQQWSVNAGGLQFRQFNLATNVAGADNAVADDVVAMQARYFVGNACVDAAPANWRQVEGVCVALLLRSKHFDKDHQAPAMTFNLPGWAASWVADFGLLNPDGTAYSCPGTGVNANAAKGCNYRYEVFSKVIPLRNLVWGNAT